MVIITLTKIVVKCYLKQSRLDWLTMNQSRRLCLFDYELSGSITER